MAVDREAIFAALFRRLAAVPGVQTASRRFPGLSATNSADYPALYLVKGDETPTQEKGKASRWRLAADILCIVRNDEATGVAPSAALNALLTGIEAALARQPNEPVLGATMLASPYGDTETTTLGGLCSHCWVSGTIRIDEGTIGGEGIAVIPIEILTLA